ncbi:MAG: hypothetical protein QOE54_2264 [Streptosporangiaceae bacterium]|jgi:hypothetical protein|nr:hypothetical protein [Streptosporangiaceae bacterium]MDX6429898.1 hypothetical protein [Streptosporangiaceae bacterium]
MNEERIKTFTSEVSELRVNGARGDRERVLLGAGVTLLGAGVALAVVGGLRASSANGLGNQVALLATGSFIGFALVVAGAALFVRYSIARFLRYWLVRLVHEQRTETDRIVHAIESLGRPEVGGPDADPATMADVR